MFAGPVTKSPLLPWHAPTVTLLADASQAQWRGEPIEGGVLIS